MDQTNWHAGLSISTEQTRMFKASREFITSILMQRFGGIANDTAIALVDRVWEDVEASFSEEVPIVPSL